MIEGLGRLTVMGSRLPGVVPDRALEVRAEHQRGELLQFLQRKSSLSEACSAY
jgi:hypothetical protein